MSSADTVAILCGNCKTPLTGPSDIKPSDVVTCAGCGQSNTLGTVLESVGKHAAEAMALSLHQTMVKGARGSKFLKVDGPAPRIGRHRWISSIKS